MFGSGVTLNSSFCEILLNIRKLIIDFAHPESCNALMSSFFENLFTET